MNRLSRFVHHQGKLLLENKRLAILHAVILALLPYTAWLSVSIVALVTLRKGWRNGGLLLAYAMLANFTLSLTSVPLVIALTNALLVFMPCYIGACVLRLTVSWRAVVGAFFIQVLCTMLILQVFMPEFIMAQFLYFQSVLREIQGDGTLFTLLNDNSNLNQMVLASYLLGLQAMGVIFSACISLLMARSVQSTLFYPGEFKREMLAFRGDKLGLLLLVMMFVASYQQNVIAMCLLPVLVFYFFLAGLSLSFNVLAKQRPLSSLVLLLVSLVLLPFVMIPVYVIFGSLDSLFNFRSYLLTDVSKT